MISLQLLAIVTLPCSSAAWLFVFAWCVKLLIEMETGEDAPLPWPRRASRPGWRPWRAVGSFTFSVRRVQGVVCWVIWTAGPATSYKV